MSYELTATADIRLTVTETADTTTSPASGTQGNARTFDAYGEALRFASTTKPPISGRPVDLGATLAAANEDIDLTAVPSAADKGVNVSVSGLKLVALIFHCPKSNAASIKLHQSGANDYNFNGGEDLVIQPGQRGVIALDGESDTNYLNPNPAVSGTAKIIRRSGTVNDVLYCLAVFGA